MHPNKYILPFNRFNLVLFKLLTESKFLQFDFDCITMPIDFVPLSELTPATGVCKINVRILRLWGFPKKDKPGEFSAIDLLLLDTKVYYNSGIYIQRKG